MTEQQPLRSISDTHNGVSRAEHLMERTRNYVDAHIQQPIKVGDLAQHLGLSERHLARLVRRYLGISVHQFILKRRLLRAKERLCGSEPLSVVAYQCGFCSQSHMNATFSRMLSLTPRQYRIQAQTRDMAEI
ncbi:MAG: AraC family transcriptional regulator [Pseudomonadota bacterium]|nr:hypothetical protein [Pseudomonadales bacterium]MDY6919138.1 AraC family transcriptional regulator [Pseudomonadota bacterium]